MYYKQIILIWICGILLASSRTSLSKSECPNMFVLSRANTTNITKTQIQDLTSTFFSIYDNQYLKQSVQSIVIEGDSQALTDFITNRITPYIVILVVFILIFLTAATCCIFDRSCPPSALRRDLKKRPYSVCQFQIVTLLTLLLIVGIIVPCFLALSYIPQLKTNKQLTKCSLYIVLDTVINGQKDTGWGGFENLYSKIQNVTKYLTSSLPAMSLYLSGNDWLIQQMQAMKQMNLNIYSLNKNATLITPNPATTKIALDNGLNYPTIESRFIQQGMGPNGTVNTMVTDIDRTLRTTQTLSSLAYSIEVGAKRVVDSTSTLLTNTNSSLDLLDMYISQLTGIKVSMNELKQSLFSQVFRYGLVLMQVSFGFLILGGFCCVMGLIATYKYEVFKCKSMVNLAWTFFGFGFMGSIVVVFVTLGLGSLGYGFCNYFEAMTSSKQEFSRIGASYSQNAFTKLDSCFFGDGNVLQKFNLGSQMGTVTKLFELIKTYYDYQNQLSINYIDKNISISRISNWMHTIDKYEKGIFVDFDESITTDDNPNFAINKLNLYTKGGAGVPVCAKDRWVYDKTNCTTPNQTIYTATDAQNGLALATTNDSICISFNQKFSDQMTTSWTPSDLTRRYTQTRGSCPNAYDKILEYAYTIIRFRDSRINLFQGIEDSLRNILTKNLIFNSNMTDFKAKLQGFQFSVSDLNNVVSNSLDGLMVSSDCRYIVDALKFTYNMVCINVMYSVVKIGWCAVIVAVFSALGMILSYIFACWFTDVERDNRWFQEGYSGDDQMEIAEISSVQVLKPQAVEKNEAYDIGKDFEKLGQFTTYTGGKSKKQKQRQAEQLKRIQRKNIDSEDSSEEQNPYAQQLQG